MAIAGLAFDIFGTVVDWRGSIAAEAERVLGENRQADWNAFAVAWRRRYQPSMDRVRNGELPWTVLDDLHAESLDDVLREQGLKKVGKQERSNLILAWHRLLPWPDSVAALDRLAGRYRLVTLSNGNRSLLNDLVAGAGLGFHEVLSAEDVQAYKPDPRMYRLAVERIGGAPEETLMVAAHIDDLQAAARSGLSTAFVSRPLEWDASGAPAEPPRPWLDHYAIDLEDLARQLGC